MERANVPAPPTGGSLRQQVEKSPCQLVAQSAARTGHGNESIPAENSFEVATQGGSDRRSHPLRRAAAAKPVMACFQRRARSVVGQGENLGITDVEQPAGVAIGLRREQSEPVASQSKVARGALLAAPVVGRGGNEDIRTVEIDGTAPPTGRTRHLGVENITAGQADILREDLPGDAARGIFRHGEKVQLFPFEMHRPRAGLVVRPG